MFLETVAPEMLKLLDGVKREPVIARYRELTETMTEEAESIISEINKKLH